MRHSGSRSRQRARFDPPSGARARWTPAAAAFAATIFVAAPARSSEAEIAAPPWADPQVHSCALEGSTAHQRLEFVACARSLIPLVHDSERIPKPDEEHRRWRAASVATLGTLAYDLAQEPKSRRVNAGLLVSIAEIASYDLSSWDAEHSAEACTLARQALKCACDLLIHEEVTTMTPESGDLERAAIRVGRECGLRSECRITAEPPSRELAPLAGRRAQLWGETHAAKERADAAEERGIDVSSSRAALAELAATSEEFDDRVDDLLASREGVSGAQVDEVEALGDELERGRREFTAAYRADLVKSVTLERPTAAVERYQQLTAERLDDMSDAELERLLIRGDSDRRGPLPKLEYYFAPEVDLAGTSVETFLKEQAPKIDRRTLERHRPQWRAP